MLELLLPRTDAGVAVQWLVASGFWLVVLVTSRRIDHSLRLLLWGLATINLAWFMLRMAH